MSSSPAASADDPHHPGHRALLIVTLGVIFLAMVRCLVVVFPEVHWDVDPRTQGLGESTSILGIGPVGAAIFDTLSVAMAGVALIVHGRLGGKLSWPVMILGAIGAGVGAWHLFQHVPGMMTQGSWIAAMALAVAMYHLAQHGLPARWLVASLAALAWPFLLRSLVYVIWEHPMTLEIFRRNEEQNILARGWQVGSPQHLLYVRRLEFADVTGAFGLSNIFGSVTAAILIAALALSAGLMVRRRWNLLWIPTLTFLAAGITLYLTHAKGPLLAAGIGGGLLGVILISTKWKAIRPVLAPLALAGLVLASGLVLARGAMGPPDSEAGERSLLFRHHYWQASVKMLAHEPWAVKLFGVGAGPYKDHYSLYKNPLNPEEVTSAHHVFVDWLAMLGLVGGLAWSLLMAGWLWQAGRGLAHLPVDVSLPSSSDDDAPTLQQALNMPVNTAGAAALGLALLGCQFYTQGAALLTPESFLAAGLSLALFIGTLAALAHAQITTRWMAACALFLDAAVLLIHAQVEMTFYNMQAAPLVFCVVAAAAGVSVGAKRASSAATADEPTTSQPTVAPAAAGGLFFLASLLLVVTYIAPVARQQAALEQAAQALRRHQLQTAYNELDRAIAILPRDPRPYVSRTMLLLEQASYLASHNQGPHAQQVISQAMIILDRAHAAGLRDVSLLRLRAQVTELAARLFNDAGRMNTAIILWQNVMKRTPQSLMDALRLADLLWQLGRQEEARTWYAQALQIHQDSYLDSARQLTADDLARVKTRLER